VIAKANIFRPMHFPGGRPLFLLVLLILLGGAVVLSTVYLWPDEDHGISFGSVENFARGSVTTSSGHDFHLVRLSSGEFLAFSTIDPHSSNVYPLKASSGECRVAWRPEMLYGSREGWFRDTCTSSTYDLDGTRVFGPSPRDLDRHPVTVEDGILYVDTSTLIQGEECCEAQR
jgi:Rieske Fe-S protein